MPLAGFALGAGIVALVLRLAPETGALAWPVAVIGAGLWLAAWVEARQARRSVNKSALYVAFGLLLAALIV